MAENETAVSEPADNGTPNEWTVMFFFAGDNSLSPLIVSQLKAIKDAGFYRDVNVLVHFDSNEVGVPMRIFNVNKKRKIQRPFAAGDEGSSLVRDMRDDNITPKEMDAILGRESAMSAALRNPDSVTSKQALENLLELCSKKFKAKNYILFLIGHGLVVGHDSFLPDEHPVSALTLADLQLVLGKFSDDIREHAGTLQLLGLNSCAMSAIEVAYELRGTAEHKTAEYMIGSEGISYIGSWPFRQMLMKLISTAKDAKDGEEESGKQIDRGNVIASQYDKELVEAAVMASAARGGDMRPLIEGLYDSALSNATDFALSGYSLDLTLCSLNSEKFEPLTDKIKLLVSLMKHALDSERANGRVIKELILLAHWESQSYWNESYTDLYDFCQCLYKRCTLLLEILDGLDVESDGTTNAILDDKTRETRDDLDVLATACTDVMKLLDVSRSDDLNERFKQIVVRSQAEGPQYQYSHGLSVFFPWSKPLDDDPPPRATLPRQTRQRQGTGANPVEPAEDVMTRYSKYKFNAEMGVDSWYEFLNTYFKRTMRDTRRKEDTDAGIVSEDPIGLVSLNSFGPAGGIPVGALTGGGGKPTGGAGDVCTCASIKNYPSKEVEVEVDAGKKLLFSVKDY